MSVSINAAIVLAVATKSLVKEDYMKMALTPAERMKRYREKLKNDPDKLDKVRKKHAEYVKSKSKNIKELSEKEKENQRKIWRTQKTNQKKMKKKAQMMNKKDLDKNKTKKKKNNKIRNLLKSNKAANEKIEALTRSIHVYRKKLHRQKKEDEKKIQELEKKIMKLKARDELLETSLKNALKECNTLKEKRILKRIILNESSMKKTYVSKLLGLKGLARTRKQETTMNKIQKEIEDFYVRDDISRITAGKKQCRTFNKKKEQIRYLTDTVVNLYNVYREQGGKYSLSTFHKYKPFYVISPNVHNRETCLCIKHANMELLFLAMKKNKIVENYNTIMDVVKTLCCDTKSKDCMYKECKNCVNKKVSYQSFENREEEQVEWKQWTVVNHKYTKTENGLAKELTTKKTVKATKEGSIKELVFTFEQNLKAFKIHQFNWLHQQNQYRKCIDELEPHEALVICDFSENYSCKMGEEVQALHFGASKNQITLHTGMIYWATKSQSFCTISDNNAHDPPAIWAHLIPVINEAKKIDPLTKVIHFYSDGPTSQYRQKKNFYLLNFFTEKLQLEYSTWSFSEAGHGKGVADGIGGSIKRSLDRQVSFGRDVENSLQAFELLSKIVKAIKIILIPSTDIDNVKKLTPENLKTIVGTMKIHQISSTLNTIQYRNLSCFCGTEKGLCQCFDPKRYEYVNRSLKNLISEQKAANDNEANSDTVLPPQRIVKQVNSISVPEESSQNVVNVINSDQKVIMVTADIHDNGQMRSNFTPKVMSFDNPIVYDKTNVDIVNQLEYDNIKSVSTNHLGDVTMSDNLICPEYTDAIENYSHIAEDQIMFDLVLDNVENENLDAMYDFPYLDARDEMLVAPEALGPNKLQYNNFDGIQRIQSHKTKNKSDKSLPSCTVDEPKAKKIKILCDKNISNEIKVLETKYKPSKSIKKAITRTLPCNKCKKHYLFNLGMFQCSSCKLFYCTKCSGKIDYDFVCDSCASA